MQQIDHRVIKLLVGLIAVFLAFFMQVVSGVLLRSISESYHYQARDWFVGLLFAVAALFLSFSGKNKIERVLTIAASLFAAMVAVAPCECDRAPTVFSALHFPAAAGLFAILGYFCWRFRKTAMSKLAKYSEAGIRVKIYTACLGGMLCCWLMAVGHVVAPELTDARFPNYMFWLETIGLISFGFSWLTASRTLPMITNSRERYRIFEGRAEED
ncbi:MAG: hypothetical protein K2P84_05970 [Undibacterium sp.]|nr:hypothetical protein [Undibacterium sp.]